MHPQKVYPPKVHPPKVYPVRKYVSQKCIRANSVQALCSHYLILWHAVMGIFRNGAILHVACTIGAIIALPGCTQRDMKQKTTHTRTVVAYTYNGWIKDYFGLKYLKNHFD